MVRPVEARGAEHRRDVATCQSFLAYSELARVATGRPVALPEASCLCRNYAICTSRDTCSMQVIGIAQQVQGSTAGLRGLFLPRAELNLASAAAPSSSSRRALVSCFTASNRKSPSQSQNGCRLR